MTARGDREPAPPASDDGHRGRRPRGAGALVSILIIAILLFAGFVALGVWQVHRRTWKLALIDRVNARVHAAPVPAPGPAQWPTIDAARDGYRHVAVRGRFRNDRETLVHASTELGPGYWVLTPLVTARGFTVLVNRGFVPPERRDAEDRQAGQIAGPVTVTGLLRITEPGGTWLRHNDPVAGRWYSRDVAAIARARGLTGPVAPYFIDADAGPHRDGAPAGGLTVVTFPNNHLVYSITWFGLALLVVVGVVVLLRDERRVRRDPSR